MSAGFSVGKITVMVSNALIDGAVHASLDGKVTKSQSISVKALGENQVESVTKTVSITIGVALEGSGASAEIGADANTDATAAATSSLTSSGLIEFDASSNNHVEGRIARSRRRDNRREHRHHGCDRAGRNECLHRRQRGRLELRLIVKAKSANDAQLLRNRENRLACFGGRI